MSLPLVLRTLLCGAATLTTASLAQMPPATSTGDVEEAEIIVTAERIAGSVETDVPPVDVLDEVALDSLGASTLTDVLEAIGSQTRSGGRGGSGPPIILLNGRRISGFSEIRDLPPEAIKRVEIFPEEVALRYGFAADQRVTNFILKDDFSAFTGEAELGGATRGGRTSSELQGTYVRIDGATRVNLSGEYERDGAIRESERGIVQPGVDTAPFRTLAPRTGELQLNSVFSRPLTEQVGATLNLRLDDSTSDALSGVPAAQLPLIGGGAIDPLERESHTRSYRGGLSMNGPIGTFQWTLTANLDHVRSRSQIERDASAAAPTRTDRFASNQTTASAIQTFTGPLFQLPAGPAALTGRFGFEQRDFTSRADTFAGITSASLDRGEGNGRVNIELPVASRRRAVLEGLGDLSLNANLGYRELTDFGGLWTYGYGGTWSPVKGLTLLATYKAEDAAPSPEQLGNPVTITPNVTVFDFVRGESAIVSVIGGGNPALRADERRDLKLGATYSPPELSQLSIETNYFRVRSRDPISEFPALTAATEAAFPGRIVRDAAGRLVSIDTRAVNYLATRSDTLRSGISFSKSSGHQGGAEGAAPSGGRPPGAGGPGGRGPGAGRPPGGGGGRGGGGPGMFGGGGGKRWNIALYHSLKLKDEVDIAPGIPVVDLLNGGAIGSNGGSPKHVIDLEGGWFDNGLGMRLFGSYQSGTRVEGGPGASDLIFSDRFTLNARFFVNFDQRKKLIEDVPFLKGSRLQLRIDNILDTAIKVRDETGATPFRYQRGFVDPIGRSFVVSFRKLF